ncbi:helicase-related protein [Pseudomaricurvus sp. HS19]|uniref:preprotein translocase subunit SecA n=1 Tax=Pseudomaricurvus sp. HS19 TaxID=2692626 RepID=UPI00136A29E0|nr:helicase-related protein [Pseudomaricurvus sp. HS19]MYM61959.1 prepilin peptidase [Pseudomaricurvus sp. HS19]
MSETSRLEPVPITAPSLITAFEKNRPREGVFERWVKRIDGWLGHRRSGRRLEKKLALLTDLSGYAEELVRLDDAQLCSRARFLGATLRHSGLTNTTALLELLASLSEVSKRSLGLQPHSVQLAGVWVLLEGQLAEMATGEGKTLVAGLAAAAAALCGRKVHVVTVNDYLAERDSAWVLPLMKFLRLSVGVVVQKTGDSVRRSAYDKPVCYCTNKELAFDYLKDARLNARQGRLSRLAFSGLTAAAVAQTRITSLDFAIVDEADSILVDEARTPLILSEGADASIAPEVIRQVMNVAVTLDEDIHFRLLAQQDTVVLLEPARQLLSREFADITCGPLLLEALREELLVKALCALYLYHANQHYLVADDRICMIDEYTGRVMPDRVWSEGLHQMIEFKEQCPLSDPLKTVARMTFQRFFRRYRTLAAMTGTAAEVRGELWQVYGLEVVAIPTHAPCARVSLPERIFLTREEKWQALVTRVIEIHNSGAPVLIGVRTVAEVETLLPLLRQAGLEFAALHAADDRQEAETIARAGQKGSITVATNMAGRGTDIALGPGVGGLGGLHVIMTERHDSGRIDRQLMGRCARQGNPGCFQAFLSLEDDLALLAAPEWTLRWARYRLRQAHPQAAANVLCRGQKQQEQAHSRARQRLLQSDQSESELLAFSGQPE